MLYFMSVYKGQINYSSICVSTYSCTVDFGYKGLGYKGLPPMRDDFSGPFVQNVRNFRQL